MKIIYINPPYGDNFVRSARWAAKSRGRVQRHPEQALIQIAVLEAAGHQCKFIDGAALNLTKDNISAQIKDFQPELVIIHTTTPSIYSDIDYAKSAKQIVDCKAVLVGAHASAEPDDCFRIAEGTVNFIIRGEVEYSLRDIATQIPAAEIKGISFWQDGNIIHNPDRAPLDVNELPFPAWQYVDPRWYQDGGKLFPFLTLYSGRGCFGMCTYCRETSVVNGRRMRMRDPKLVVNEMEYDLRLFPYLKEIMFETDTFTAVKSHVEGVCNEIIRCNLHKKISWSCNARVDIDLTLLPLMKKAGCRMLMVGFEFGTNAQLDSVKKGTTIEQSKAFAKEAHRLGFTIHGCFMIGAPGETAESAQATINFAKSLPLDTIQVSGIAVYPGTELYTWAKENGFLTAKDWTEWVNADHEQVTILSYPQFSKEQIDLYIDKALKEFYLRPAQIAKMILKLRNWADFKRKLFGFKSFLDYFLFGKVKK